MRTLLLCGLWTGLLLFLSGMESILDALGLLGFLLIGLGILAGLAAAARRA